ncbi:MAG TPA: patatin-like phospholipase family protein [Candidatus Polarisedimenticolia bacterium]|nr:patatin-like phospholipase family protein [Candidatus Polarisedimenticolia bacterium]
MSLAPSSESAVETTAAAAAAELTANSPVDLIPPDVERPEGPEEGIALCLSGGGYRAMLFHAGALIRLNQWGLLPRLRRVSSVSGGSITAGALACAWSELAFDPATGVSPRLGEKVIDPLRRLAHRTLDVVNVALGGPLPGSIAEWIAGSYDRHLFRGKTLQDMPDDQSGPRFIFCATNVMTKALFRFSRPYLADWRIGQARDPRLPIATAVAASAAFPPFLSPLTLDLDDYPFQPTQGADHHQEPYTLRAVLTDGGVYDNLGLETAWKRYRTVLVSDAGGTYGPEKDPKTDWLRHSQRVIGLVYDQVRVLRTRQTIDAFRRQERDGALWTVRTDLSGADPFRIPAQRAQAMADVETRLRAMDETVQQQLINWGYVACDAAARAYWRRPPAPLTAPTALPFPDASI